MTGPLTILHVLEPEPDGTIGGADTHVLALAGHQASSGSLNPHLFLNQNRWVAEQATKRGIGVHGGHHLAAGKIASTRALRHVLARLNPDIVHSHGYDANFVLVGAVWPTWRTDRPAIVMTAHGWVDGYWRHRLKTRLDMACHRLADGIILCAEHQRRSLGRLANGRLIEIIPNGVDRIDASGPVSKPVQRIRSLADAGKLIVGSVGRLSREKRWQDAILAFSKARLGPDVAFVLIGEGPERANLVKLASAVETSENIHLVGFARDVARAFAAFDVFLHVSERETNSRVTLEAMAHGRPVIVAAADGITDVIQHEKSGLICPVGDINALADALDDLTGNSDRRAHLGRCAVARHSQGYTVEAMAAAVARFYERTLIHRSGSVR